MDTEEEKNIIIDMAAAIIRDSIRSKTYDMDQYPDMRCLDIQGDVPCEVDRFMKGVIKTKSKATDNVMHRRIIAISHSMIYACRPRSYISRVMLTLSIYVYKKYETRNLVDILCNLGYGASYDEVGLFLDNARDTLSHVEQISNLGEEASVHAICV